MDKIAKFLKKLTPKERSLIEELIVKLLKGETDDLDTKKLKGFDDIFRVRLGNIRVMYRKTKADIIVIEISRRNENTYKGF